MNSITRLLDDVASLLGEKNVVEAVEAWLKARTQDASGSRVWTDCSNAVYPPGWSAPAPSPAPAPGYKTPERPSLMRIPDAPPRMPPMPAMPPAIQRSVSNMADLTSL